MKEMNCIKCNPEHRPPAFTNWDDCLCQRHKWIRNLSMLAISIVVVAVIVTTSILAFSWLDDHISHSSRGSYTSNPYEDAYGRDYLFN